MFANPQKGYPPLKLYIKRFGVINCHRPSRLHLTREEPKRVRQLYRAMKFHGLMCRVHTEADGLVLEVDGPGGLLQRSTRCGLQLGLFLPTVLLLPERVVGFAEVIPAGKVLERLEMVAIKSSGD